MAAMELGVTGAESAVSIATGVGVADAVATGVVAVDAVATGVGVADAVATGMVAVDAVATGMGVADAVATGMASARSTNASSSVSPRRLNTGPAAPVIQRLSNS